MSIEERFLRKLSGIYRTKPDFYLLFATAVLVAIGFVMIFSTTPSMGIEHKSAPTYYVIRHIASLLVGAIALFIGFKMDLKKLQQNSGYLLVAAIFLLLLVKIIGASINGADRWLSFGAFRLQPSEIAKIALIIFVASELATRSIKVQGRSILAFCACAGLVVLQPDMGTAIIITTIVFTMFFMAGAPIIWMLSAIFAGLLSVILLSTKMTHMKNRLLAFIDPAKYSQSFAYQVNQSILAVGSGGIFGLGLGNSKQKLYYLTQNYTDFIFSIYCEELGLIGSVFLIGVFLLFIGRCVRTMLNCPDKFGVLLVGGITAWIASQAILNMLVVLRLAPATGIPIPFISYGGTSLVILLFSVGIVLNVSTYKSSQADTINTKLGQGVA